MWQGWLKEVSFLCLLFSLHPCERIIKSKRVNQNLNKFQEAPLTASMENSMEIPQKIKNRATM